MGLGAPELVVVLIILALFALPMIALVVWLVVRRTRGAESVSVSRGAHKKCPDCAELVLVEARVCKHCGYRFAGEEPNKA